MIYLRFDMFYFSSQKFVLCLNYEILGVNKNVVLKIYYFIAEAKTLAVFKILDRIVWAKIRVLLNFNWEFSDFPA